MLSSKVQADESMSLDFHTDFLSNLLQNWLVLFPCSLHGQKPSFINHVCKQKYPPSLNTITI